MPLLRTSKAPSATCRTFPSPAFSSRTSPPCWPSPTPVRRLASTLAGPSQPGQIDAVVGIDARGFIFAAAAALQLRAGFVPVRKKGKLPYHTYEESYDLEYGSNTIAIHVDAVAPGSRVLLIDDLLATGGTAAAAASLVTKAGAQVLEIAFFIELSFLHGREKLQPHPVRSLVVY